MNQKHDTSRLTTSTRASSDEIIKSARRRARAADSRRRALIGDGTVTDGSLALKPELDGESVNVSSPVPVRRASSVKRRRSVALPESSSMPRTPFALSVLALVATGIVGLLVLNTAINENAYTLHDLHGRQAELDTTEERLTDEIAELSAPGNLAAAAERLGLVEATSITYIRLPDGKELKMPTPGGN